MRHRLCSAIVGIAATGLLLAIGYASDDQSQQVTNRNRSKENLQTLMKAMHKYVDEHGTFPPAAIYDRDGKALLSWRVLILPYVGDEEKELFKQFKLSEPWDSPHNKKLSGRVPKAYSLTEKPSDQSDSILYKAFIGKGAAFEKGATKGPTIAEFKDGTVGTILIVEAQEAAPWTKPSELEYDPDKALPGCGGLFSDGFHAAFASGDVYFVKKDPPESSMRAAITRASGEIFNPETDLPLAK